MTDLALEVRDLRSGYGRVDVLHGLSLQVGSGQIVALVGRNGAGKSTLLGTISGLVRPQAGSVLVGGEDVTKKSPQAILGRGLVHVQEGRRLFRRQTVASNLDLGMYGLTLTDAERRERVDEALALFPALRGRMGERAGVLSGGQQQMLAVAQALVRRPRILMLDEPSLGLAPVVVAELLDVVAGLPARGTSVLLVEQMVEQAIGISDYVYVIGNGRVVAEGVSSQDLMEAVQRAYVGASSPLDL